MRWTSEKCNGAGSLNDGGYDVWVIGEDIITKVLNLSLPADNAIKVNLSPGHGSNLGLNPAKAPGYPVFPDETALEEYMRDSFSTNNWRGTISIAITVKEFSNGYGTRLDFNRPIQERPGPLEWPGKVYDPRAKRFVPGIPNRIQQPRFGNGFTAQGDSTHFEPSIWARPSISTQFDADIVTWQNCGGKFTSSPTANIIRN